MARFEPTTILNPRSGSMQGYALGRVRKTFFELTLVWSGFPFVLEPENHTKKFETFSICRKKWRMDPLYYAPQKEWESRPD